MSLNNIKNKEHETLQTYFSMLEYAIKNHSSALRNMQVATLSQKKTVAIRTVILRKAILNRQTLMFYTDIRSSKINDIKHQPNIQLHFYEDHIQFRFNAYCHIHHHSELSDKHYSTLNQTNMKNYASKLKPGTSIKSPHDNQLTIESSHKYFAVCVCNFNSLDILDLSTTAPTRILYNWDTAGDISSTFLVP